MLTSDAHPTCPSCRSERVAWVLYGLPLSIERLQPDPDAGRVILGGCGCSENDPPWQCRACGYGWGRPEHLDALHRLRRAAEAAPASLGRRCLRWSGFTLDEESLLDGLARRLAWATAGAGVVLAVGSITPPWAGMAVLAVWFLPLLCHAALRQFAVLLGLGFVALIGFRALNGQVMGFVVVTLLEECVVVVAMTVLGGWHL